MWKTPFVATAFLATLFVANEAAAQRPNIGRPPVRRTPTTSPYLNLLRRSGGGGIGFNYYERVRPEMEFRAANSAINRQLNSLQQQMQSRNQQQRAISNGSGLGRTGHPVQFMSFGRYFPGFGNR
ncbi:MAG: hypothetical protein ACE5KM_03715 [Planctomycetaceae bacterium]